MKRLSLSLFGVSILAMMPVIAGAAGTYYNGNTYQNSQRYGSTGGGYYNNYGAGRGYGQSQPYGQNQSMMVRNTKTTVTKKSSAKQQQKSQSKQGFQLGVALTHEFANWDVEMNNAGSKLRYDGLAWNVLSADGVYYFDTSTPMQVNFGARYGKQFGETSMSDDDITNGAYDSVSAYGGTVDGYAMSLGTGKDGTQMGFNVGLGLTDFFAVGRVKMTPSIGYRYFKHKLVTKNNSGLAMDVYRGFCESVGDDDEIQCPPFVAFYPFYDSTGNIIYNGNVPYYVVLNGGLYEVTDLINSLNSVPGADKAYLNLGDSYYYVQPGTSHEYETEWYGPYVALDMEYAINNTNNVTMGIELGLPMYNSKGNQPYRVDWAHPTSVEDKGSFGDAYHLGLNAAWSTAITDSVMFSLGVTYDYYNARKADATTYLNSAYYEEIYDSWKDIYDVYADKIANNITLTEAQEAEYNTAAVNLEDLDPLRNAGWKIESKDEIKSIYSSMGIRMGINIKF